MSRSKRELIITFLALLEMVKEWKIYLTQSELFGDIFARKRAEDPRGMRDIRDIEEEPAEQNNQESETDLSLSVA
jgi:chromatin segregation and condensation protein Rec8/ScpA/Scc1 (kleisin family)